MTVVITLKLDLQPPVREVIPEHQPTVHLAHCYRLLATAASSVQQVVFSQSCPVDCKLSEHQRNGALARLWVIHLQSVKPLGSIRTESPVRTSGCIRFHNRPHLQQTYSTDRMGLGHCYSSG